MIESCIRYVVTGVRPDGLRGMVDAVQGRNTFGTPQEAADQLKAMRENNSPGLLSSFCGTDLAVCRAQCYSVHHDPIGCWFKEEDIISR